MTAAEIRAAQALLRQRHDELQRDVHSVSTPAHLHRYRSSAEGAERVAARLKDDWRRMDALAGAVDELGRWAAELELD